MSHKPNILLALHRFETGGAERQALYLAHGLVNRGYAITVIGFGSIEGLVWQRFKDLGIEVIALGFSEKLILNESKGLKTRYFKWKYANRLIAVVKKRGIDIIFPFTYRPNVIFGMYWRQMGAKACYWNQRDEGRSFNGSQFQIKAIKNCSGILSNSLEGKYFLDKFIKLPITLVHNGVEIPYAIARRNDLQKIRVVMVANLKSYKDHMTLLKAWKIVTQEVGHDNLELILAGKEGDTTKLLKGFVLENNLQQSVLFFGQVSDVGTLLQECHISVFSSNNEGLPNGILESMASELPVVATRILGSEEALGVEYDFLTNRGDHQDLAAKLLTLIRSKELRTSVGRQNRQRVLGLFGVDKMVDHYISLIERA